ncbi:hypothetical protein [Pseudogemmobacter sonorensis]|uniref:hypothetical protein n=1 Tax=Pseudogemmobacter sonorensis TaxID=2989681 RepID=UPI003693B7BA
MRFGSPDRAGLAFDFSQPLTEGGRLPFPVTGLASGIDGNVDGSRTERYMLAPSLTRKISETTELTVQAGIIRDPGQRPCAVPARRGRPLRPSGRAGHSYDFNLEGPEWSGLERKQKWIGYEVTHRFSPGVMLTHALRCTHLEAEQYSIMAPPLAAMAWVDPNGSELCRLGSRFLEHSRMPGTDTRLEFRFETGAAMLPC